jgi:flagellar biosynthesis protein FliR
MADAIAGTVAAGNELMTHADHIMWLALRIGGTLLAAPMFGTRALPMRVRVLLAISLAMVFAPMLPSTPVFHGLDAALAINVAGELVVGIAMGLILRLSFEAGSCAGEWVAQGMGLSFAQMADPLQGTNSGIVGQWFYAAFGLLFLAMNGHLRMMELLFSSYAALPMGQALAMSKLMSVPLFLSDVLIAGVHIALPIMIAMLTTNLAFGVLARAAPALNPMAVGLPAALALGLIMLVALTGRLLGPAAQMFDLAFDRAAALVL